MQTFSNLLPLAENRLALAAAQRVASGLGSPSSDPLCNPLFLHGPTGCGKSHLVWALVHEVTQQAPATTVSLLSARDLHEPISGDADARDSDLLVIEDLHALPAHAAAALVALIDQRLARQLPMVFTATLGPAQLPVSARLSSRLAAGLVVGMQALSAASRRALLEDRGQRRGLRVDPDVLAWPANHLPGGVRQLDGALNQLETLNRLNPRPPELTEVMAHFRDQAEASRPTVERIAQRVSGHFRVDPRRVRSRRRHHNVLRPRQVSMYLARELTGLSLHEIGRYFGGRDHTTVLHACRTVEQALATDAVLSGTVRQLHADLA